MDNIILGRVYCLNLIFPFQFYRRNTSNLGRQHSDQYRQDNDQNIHSGTLVETNDLPGTINNSTNNSNVTPSIQSNTNGTTAGYNFSSRLAQVIVFHHEP